MQTKFRIIASSLILLLAFTGLISPALAQQTFPAYAYSDGHNLIVVDRTGTSHTVTTFPKTGDDPIESIAWSPNGSVIAFAADLTDSSGNPTGTGLFITDGKSPATQLTDKVDPIFPICFTPDGELFFTEPSPNNAQVTDPSKASIDLYFVDPKAGATPQLLQPLSFDIQFGDGFNPILPLAQYKHESRHVEGNYLTLAPVADGLVYTPSASGIGLKLFVANLELPVNAQLTRVAISPDGKQVAGLITANGHAQIAVVTLATSPNAKSTVKMFKTTEEPDQLVWGDANTIYYTSIKTLGAIFTDAELKKLNGLINANDSTPIDDMNNRQVSIRALNLTTSDDSEVYSSDPKPDSADNSYAIARLSDVDGKVYFTSVPGVSGWARQVLAGKMDVQTPNGLDQADALFPLRVYQLDPTTKAITLVGSGLHHITFQTSTTTS